MPTAPAGRRLQPGQPCWPGWHTAQDQLHPQPRWAHRGPDLPCGAVHHGGWWCGSPLAAQPHLMQLPAAQGGVEERQLIGSATASMAVHLVWDHQGGRVHGSWSGCLGGLGE